MRYIVINSLEEYLKSGICCEHLNKSELIRARGVVVKAKSKISPKTKSKFDEVNFKSANIKNKNNIAKKKINKDYYFKLDVDPETDFNIERDLPFYYDDKLETYQHKIYNTLPHELLGGLILPTNDNLFGRCCADQINCHC